MKTCPVCSTEYPDDVKFCANDGTTLRAAAPVASLVGQVIADRYHVVKKLGEGGMGQVYLAEHVKMGRRSAIKVMNPSMVHDPDAVARFNREAANASRITHPNVCAVYDFGETPDGMIYLAMEFIEGEPLTDVLEREGALPLARAVSIFKQTADALQAAHDLGIVHRDLKPDNIMLTRSRDGADVVKVVDFGIAKAIGGDETGQKVTKTGLVVGTPEFMSPEQLSGDKVDGRSDLYSLALVFFRMLTGILPFQAETVQETMIKRLTDEPAKLATVRPDLAFPPGLQDVLDQALTRLPSERYQTVAKFGEDVKAVTQSVSATRAGAPVTRADVEAKTQILSSQETRAMAAPGGRKNRSLIPVIAGVVAVVGLGGGAWVLFGKQGSAAPSDSTQVTTPDSAKPATDRGTTTQPRVVQLRDTAHSQSGGPKLPPDTPAAGSLNAAAATALLDRLIEAPPGVIVDSAAMVYGSPAASTGDRAFAACLLAQAYQNLGQRQSALDWARKGLALNASLTACSDVVNKAGQ